MATKKYIQGTGIMVDTFQQLTAALLKYGQHNLEHVWSVSTTEVSRRVNNQRGMLLSDFAAALDAAGVDVVTGDEHVVLHEKEYDALRTMANLYLQSKDSE